MKNFLRILSHLKAYRGRIGLNLFYNLLNALFSVVSFSAIIPFLKILFDTTNDTAEKSTGDGLENSLLATLNHWFDSFIVENGARQALLIFCVILVFLFLTRNLFRYLAQHQMAYLRNAVVRDIRKSIYIKLLRLSLAYFTDERKGNIYSRFTNDVTEVEWSAMGALEAMFRQPVMIVFYAISLLLISWQLTAFVLIVLPISGFLIGKIGKSLKSTARKGQAELGEVVSILEETVGGIRIIKGFTAESRFYDYFNERTNKHFRLMVKLFRKQYLASPISETLSTLTIALILWFGGNLVLEGNLLNGEMFILYIAIFSQMISPVKTLTEAFARVQRGISATERIDEVLNADEQIHEISNAKPVSSFRSAIKFNDVSFKYKQEWVLRNINIEVHPGESIALVGPSGGGKSTLIDLLPRFYDIDEGQLTLDDIPLSELKVNELRSLFGIVSQHSILFNDTVRNNLLIGAPDTSEKEIIEALHAANAHGFVMALPNGLDTVIGESGNKLSGGQKQRLSIARAILKNPPILILDEATSALDTESERLVQDALAKVMRGRTSFVIAHRLSTVSHANRIIVIERGEIVESGSHAELLAKNGTYKKLVDLQEIQG